MMIRDAKGEDFDALLAMGERFYNNTAYAAIAGYEWDAAAALFDLLIRDGLLLVAEEESGLVGMVGLVIVPFMFNTRLRSAHEVVWYVDPDARRLGIGPALLKAVEPACREKGVDVIQMMNLATSNSATTRMYERMGFKHSESSYLKVI